MEIVVDYFIKHDFISYLDPTTRMPDGIVPGKILDPATREKGRDLVLHSTHF